MPNDSFLPRYRRYLGDATPDDCTCDLLDKQKGVKDYVAYMFARTAAMFEYSGLPDTIPAYLLEYYLQSYGIATFAEVKGELYAFRAHLGGAPDPYYRPTIAVVANPALNLSQDYQIANHFPPYDRSRWTGLPPAVVMYNDSQLQGLMPLYARYATQLTENDISIRSAQINARQQAFVAAQSDRELASAKRYMEDLEAGKLAVVASAPFLEGISAVNVATGASNSIIQLIELQQYLKAAWFNDIGLNANFNMKREYLSSEEIATNTDILLPLADDMLKCRENALEVINTTFGTSISVSKNSAWERKEEEQEASLEAEREGSSDDSEPENPS